MRCEAQKCQYLDNFDIFIMCTMLVDTLEADANGSVGLFAS